MKLNTIANPSMELFNATIEVVRGLTSGGLIDEKMSRVSWPFIYSVTNGMFVGEKNTYHLQLINSVEQSLFKLLLNIYAGGEYDEKDFTHIPNSRKPGLAGRIGHNLSPCVSRALKNQPQVSNNKEIVKYFENAKVVTFYDIDEMEWMQWSLYELLEKGWRLLKENLRKSSEI